MTDNNELDSLSIDSLTETEAFPEVNEAAMTAISADREEKAIDEKIEETVKLKKDGTPAKKRGRKPNSEKKPFYNPEEKQEKTGDQNPLVSSEYAATTVSAMFENITVRLISSEWELSPTERVMNVNAWRDTFDYYGGVTLTPPQALALSHLNIILTRIPKPETQSKFSLFKAWLKVKIQNWKNKNALPDNRTDIKRENDTGEKEGSKHPRKIG